MVFNQRLKQLNLNKISSVWIWVGVFLLSISGTSYLGLNPDLIDKSWVYLVTYNIIMSIVAIYYIYAEVMCLKHDVSGDIVGSKFTWSFIKIVPILMIVPVLSFYTFSFQNIQANVRKAEKTFDTVSQDLIKPLNTLHTGIQKVRGERYREQTKGLLVLIKSFSDNFKKDSKNYKESMQTFLNSLIDKGWACQITLFNEKQEIIAKTANITNCITLERQLPMNTKLYTVNEDDKNNIILATIYASDLDLLKFLKQVNSSIKIAQSIKFTVNTSITQKRFMIDFSSTVLLAVLSALMIVLRMIEKLMKPLNNLSMATKEIAQGNYDVRVSQQRQSDDVRSLINQFNAMSRQIKVSKERLDTHNLYLETILKYSYGVIALDKNKKIRLINPVIGDMFGIKNEQQFIGSTCLAIGKQYPNLAYLFALTTDRFKQKNNEWSKEVKVTLSNRHLLLDCQGAVLKVDDKTLGYVIVIKDISKLHQAQRKAAWGEVAMRMAHEIKNPLTPILLSAQRLRNRFIESLQDQDLKIIDKTTNTIINQVQSMNEMVNAFADYANAPNIKKSLNNLNEIITQSIALYDAQKNITLSFNLTNNMPLLLLNTNSISRMLINLIKNASESTSDERDLTINITTQYLPKQQIVRLNIADNGDGFDKDILDKVFEPYVTSKDHSSGLGMAIVQNIVEQHDARILASNLVPNGALITIEFNYKQ